MNDIRSNVYMAGESKAEQIEDYYHDLLCSVWSRDTSADDAMEEIRQLIGHINELRNAAIDCIDHGETDALDLAVWRTRNFAEGDQ